MNFNEYKKNILKYITYSMQKNETKKIPNPESIGYNVYNEAWAIVISANIRNYKEMIKYYERWAIIRIIQAFTNSIISSVSDSEHFVDAYVNGDEVIIVFRAEYKEKISKIFKNELVTINSIANYLLPKLLKENGYNYEFKVGIGCWLSQNNSLIKYGEIKNKSFFTTIGDSINYASKLAKLANKNSNSQVLYNNVLVVNLINEGLENHKKLGSYQFDLKSQSIYGFNFDMTQYNE